MKTTSNVIPQSFLIEAIHDGDCDVLFATNVTPIEIQGEDEDTEVTYEYELYRIRIPYADNLETRIENNYDAWLNRAINTEVNLIKNEKIAEVRSACEAAIVNGIDVVTEFGNEHFSLATHDQQNLATIKMIIDGGVNEYPYHADGKQCVMYSAEDLAHIIETATYHVAYHTTYCNMLRVWIGRETSYDVVYNIKYGDDLPSDLDEAMRELVG